MSYVNVIDQIISPSLDENSVGEMMGRNAGYHIDKEIDISVTGSQTVNVLQLTGTVVITNQWAQITDVTTLANLTGMYADLYDGTNTVALTANGAVLSGAPVGTFFTKDKISSEAFSVNMSDECRMIETLLDKKSGRPFTITQKNNTDTFIRLNFTTTDNPVVFSVKIHFEFYPVNGSTLVFL